MTVRGPYTGSIDVRRLYVPGGSGAVERASSFVAGGSTGTLMKRGQDVDAVLALDVHGGHCSSRGHRSSGGSSSSSSRGLSALTRSALGRGGHASVERGELVHHALVLLLLISVNGLRVLAKIVETRELLAAMAGEGAFAGVFPAKGRSGRGKGGRGEGAYLMCLARCSLLLKTILQSP